MDHVDKPAFSSKRSDYKINFPFKSFLSRFDHAHNRSLNDRATAPQLDAKVIKQNHRIRLRSRLKNKCHSNYLKIEPVNAIETVMHTHWLVRFVQLSACPFHFESFGQTKPPPPIKSLEFISVICFRFPFGAIRIQIVPFAAIDSNQIGKNKQTGKLL